MNVSRDGGTNGAELLLRLNSSDLFSRPQLLFKPVATREFGAVVEGDRVATFLVEFFQALLKLRMYMSGVLALGPIKDSRPFYFLTASIVNGVLLQWGRGHVTAESSTKLKLDLQESSFNGAAVT